MKRSWHIALVTATLLLATSVKASSQERRIFPLHGTVNNGSLKPGLSVRTQPPEVVPAYKLGDHICSVGNGSEFIASREVRLANGEIWFKVDRFRKITTSAGKCSINSLTGWMIAKYKDGRWAISIAEQGINSASLQPSMPKKSDSELFISGELAIWVPLLLVLLLALGIFSRVLFVKYRSRRALPPLNVREQEGAGDSSDRFTVFISYRRSESIDITGRIYDRLSARLGKENIFKDVDSIPLGVDFRRHIESRVSACSIMLVVIGNQWLKLASTGSRMSRLENLNDYVRIEVESALRRDIPVVPLLVQGASMPSEEDLPLPLRDLAYRNAIEIRSDPHFHKDVDRLIAGLVHKTSASKRPNLEAD